VDLGNFAGDALEDVEAVRGGLVGDNGDVGHWLRGPPGVMPGADGLE
jgi:hypothetical protein